MKIILDLLKIVGVFALIAALIIAGLVISAYMGYGFGMILAWGAGGALTGVFGIEESTIPTIVAWIFVVGSIIGMSVNVDAKDE